MKKRKPAAEDMMPEGQWISPRIVHCEDGKYRWIYSMSLFKNPTFFVLIWKIFFFIFLGIFAVVMLADGEHFLDTLKFFGYFLIGMTAVVGISYLIYAAIMGGKYIVLFEMDEKGIVHKQIPKQAKKMETLAMLTTLAGIAAGKPSTVGIGIAASRTSMYSEFAKVRKVKAYPRRDLIKINERLEHNQVYADKEDFDFVLNYITERVPGAQKTQQ